VSSLIREDFESGVPGAAVTTSNTTLPVAPTIGAGASVTFDTSIKHGTFGQSAKVFCGNPASFTVMRAVSSATDLSLLYVRTYVQFDTIPTSNATFMSMADGSGLVLAGIQLDTTGHLKLRLGTATTVATSTLTVSADTWYGLEWGADVAGTIQTLRIYDADHTNIVEELGGTAGSFTGTSLRRWSIGNVAGSPASWTLWFDDVAANDSTWVGPLGTAAPDVTVDAPASHGVGAMPVPGATTSSTPDLINEPFESGSNGVTISTSNTTLPTNPTIGSGATVTFDSSVKHLGALSAKIFGGNPAAFTVMLPVNNTVADITSLYTRFYVRFGSIPTTNATFAAFATSAGVTLARLQIMTTGAIRVQNGAGTSTVGTTTTILAANTWYGIEWHAQTSGTTQTFRLYDALHTDLLETQITGTYTGTGLRRIQLGNITGWPNSYTVWFDDVAADDTTWVGPLGVPTPPSATVYLPDGLGGWAAAQTVLVTNGVVAS
jgi:hypothetical protein